MSRELQRHQLLGQLLSTYPARITARWGIDRDRILGEPALELLRRFGPRQKLVDQQRLQEYLAVRHGRNARRLVADNDVFIGWSGSSLEALIAAREAGKITILERGSSHCNEWRALMREESRRFGQAFDEMYFFWQRELMEYELADFISVPSTFVRDSFLKHNVPAEKLLVNAYGVDLGAFRKVEKTDDTFRVINVGGFHRRKGSHYLLQAFAELDLPDAEFWHVGSVSPEMRPVIERYADDRCTFHGHQPQDQLYKFYSQASVFALASIEEGMAMVQCQAMACGLPLICTTNTGGADLIGGEGHAGHVVPIRDVEALKARILHLYENRDLAAEMGRRAQARVSNGLTWADYGDRYAANIRRIVAERAQDGAAVGADVARANEAWQS
ncbi:glycosyltransferase family 4 protein [Mameliella sp.]|uniref:glycosyltransferase family 4 protein n=1 Tax=Mameliella sp. TaxID=1924940 RepID=UPI003BAA2085